MKGRLAIKKKELDTFRDKGADMSLVYINGIEHEASILQEILSDIHEIRRDTPPCKEELAQKMYGV